MEEWTDKAGQLFYSASKAASRCPPTAGGWSQRGKNSENAATPGPFDPRKVRSQWFFLASAVEAARAEHLRGIGAVEPPVDQGEHPDPDAAKGHPAASVDSNGHDTPTGPQDSGTAGDFASYLQGQLADRDRRLDALRSELEQARVAQQRSDDKYADDAAKLAKLRADYALVVEVARRAGLDDTLDMDKGPSQ